MKQVQAIVASSGIKPPSGTRIADGSRDWSAGIDSGRLPTIQGPNNPNGLLRTQLAWLSNGTVRGGAITPRNCFQKLCTVHDGSLVYQGGFLYQPLNGNPYLMLSIGGQIFQVRVDTDNSVNNISSQFDLFNPSNTPQVWMEQAEQFLVIQAGDYLTATKPTLPLFWDGATLKRSVGILGSSDVPYIGPGTGGEPFNQIPAAGPMCYYQDRLWYAQGPQYSAGDIVYGNAGTASYSFTDSVLYVTENPMAIGGDGFRVGSNAGNITALSFSANLNATLGEGPLYVFTRNSIYSLTVPITRADWIAANSTNMPQQIPVQINYGAVGDRSVVRVNGDIFYQSLEPAIRSLTISVRNFQQWANVPISRNENRVLSFSDTSLMPTSPGVLFDNRLLMGVLPFTTPVGTAFQGLVPLDFDIISTFGQEGYNPATGTAAPRPPPAWEGLWQGANALQLFSGDFGGLERAFVVVYSQTTGGIELWELSDTANFDNINLGDVRVQWYFETPAYTWGDEFDLKRLDGGELWVDQIYGTCDFKFEYRCDSDGCWHPWFITTVCSARNSCETVDNPICYPIQEYQDGYKFPITLPSPKPDDVYSTQKRNTNIGYEFQVRVSITGSCRVRGLILYAVPWERTPFEGLNK